MLKLKHIILLFLIYFISEPISSQGNNYTIDRYYSSCNKHIQKDQLDSALKYLNKLSPLIKNNPDSSFYFKFKLLEGSYYTAKSEYDLAMKNLLIATKYFNLINDSVNYYDGKYRLAVCYYYLNRRDDALELMNDISNNSEYISEGSAINIDANIGALNIEIGMQRQNDSLIKDAVIRLSSVIGLIKTNKIDLDLSAKYSLLAEAYNQLKNSKKALELLDSAVAYANKTNSLSAKGFALIKQANILTVNEKFDSALIKINQAEYIYKYSKDLTTKIYVFVEKKKLLYAMQRFKEACQISDSIYNYSISNYNNRFADGISKMKVQYNTAEKEVKILEQRAVLAEKELLIQEKNFLLITILIIGILVLSIGFQLYNKQKLKQKQLIKENLLKSELQNIEIKNELQGQRIRISRELHDNIGSHLTFLISSIDNLSFKEQSLVKKEKMQKISKFGKQTMNELRGTIWAIKNESTSLKELYYKVLDLKKNVESNLVIINNIVCDKQLSAKQLLNLYRIIQEGIQNASKYANASIIEVRFLSTENEIKIIINDNGNGFKTMDFYKSNGINNMRYRSESINAIFSIESIINERTTIVCSLPL